MTDNLTAYVRLIETVASSLDSVTVSALLYLLYGDYRLGWKYGLVIFSLSRLSVCFPDGVTLTSLVLISNCTNNQRAWADPSKLQFFKCCPMAGVGLGLFLWEHLGTPFPIEFWIWKCSCQTYICRNMKNWNTLAIINKSVCFTVCNSVVGLHVLNCNATLILLNGWQIK
jgi:hypothetical protein